MMQVKTIQDVEKFANWLMIEKGVAFHPDTPFQDYVTLGSKNLPTFSDKECETLENSLMECYRICDEKSVDIYDIMGKIAYDHLKKQCTKAKALH